MSESEESWDEMNDVRDSDDEESGADEEEMDTSEEVIKTHGEHKLEGNEFYKKKDYRAAVASYTNAIDLALVAFEELDKETDKDAKDELEKKEFQLPDDPSGGMGQIAVASIKHSKDEDKKYLQDLLEGYSMGGKGPNGLPNGERVLPKE